ncbi:MAG: hypothetical protein WKF97_11955 [Chitinophagaceae bacterium]
MPSKTNNLARNGCIALVLILANCSMFAQTNAVGIFKNHADIGHPKNAGTSRYDEATQTYILRGSGYNIWFNRDEFQYAYNKIGGDFILTANFEFLGDQGNGHRKTGWMIRESTDEGAAHFSAVTHGDGLTVFQWRPLRGAYMRDPEDEIFFAKKVPFQTIQLERSGRKITMRVANRGEPLQEVGSQEMQYMRDSVLAGLFISSHDSNRVEEAMVWNVRIDKPVPTNYSPNPQIQRTLPRAQPILDCRLETMNVFDGKRKVILESTGRLESPDWMPDGSKLLFKQNGVLHTIPVEGGTPQELHTDTASKNVHTVTTKKGVALTANVTGRVDGPEHSPDGKYVYYNANPSGTMQIWRMRPDGSGKEQMTFDEYHNWFPHISPDSKWIAFISAPADIDPDSLPSYKQVTLRLMPALGGAPRVIAYLYGGQGTMKENSWSPDSKHIAFVSNSEQAVK